MKITKRIFIIFLSIFIVCFSFSNCYLISYASHGGGGGSGNHGVLTDAEKKEKVKDIADNFGKYCTFLMAQLGAFSNGSFATALENYELLEGIDWKSHVWNENNIYVDDSGEITFSKDLVSSFKQALLEVAEETNGFEICSTIDYRTVSPTTFKSSYAYDSFLNLVRESGVIAMYEPYKNYFYACRPFHSSRPISLVVESENINSFSCYFYDTETWINYYFPGYSFEVQYTDENGYSFFKTFKSFDEGTPVSGSGGLAQVIYAGIFKTYVSVDVSNVLQRLSFNLYSVDGRKMKVFNSLNALKNYTTGNRSVYFGSGFYDDPGEIKVSFDDLEKYINGKYDKFFDDLKDLIGSDEDSLTEEDLEKLVDKILDKMDDTGGGSGTGGDNSGILSEILSTLSGYFDSVLAYLDSILTSVQGLIFVETVKPDDEHMDLSDMINDVWKDPQNGSQAVADSLSASFSDIGSALMAKFPFCIPNDLYSFFSVLTNIPESRAAPMSLEDDGIQAYAEVSAAPRFELPLMIEAFGIEEIIVIDMSDFTPLSKNARTFLSLIFAVSLMKFTVVIVGLINDAWGGIA